MTPRAVFTPEAEQHLVDLYRYIAANGYPEAAARFTDSIVAFGPLPAQAAGTGSQGTPH